MQSAGKLFSRTMLWIETPNVKAIPAQVSPAATVYVAGVGVGRGVPVGTGVSVGASVGVSVGSGVFVAVLVAVDVGAGTATKEGAARLVSPSTLWPRALKA